MGCFIINVFSKFKPDYSINFLWHLISALVLPLNSVKIAAVLDILTK